MGNRERESEGESWNERVDVVWNRKRRKERELCALISPLVFQSARLSGTERPEQRRREREREQNGNVRETERGVSFSSVWPLSHSNSGLATWTPVPLSSPTAENLTPSAPDYSIVQQHRARRDSVRRNHDRQTGQVSLWLIVTHLHQGVSRNPKWKAVT